MRKILFSLTIAVAALVLFASPFKPLAASSTTAPTNAPGVAQSSGLPYVLQTVSMGAHPKGVMYHEWTYKALVALFDASRIATTDPNGGGVTTYDTGGLHPNQLLRYVPHSAYLTLRDSNRVTLIDPYTMNILRSISTSMLPWGIAASANGQIYVGNFGSGTVSVFDLNLDSLKATITLPNDAPAMLNWGKDNRILVPGWNTGKLYVIDAATNTVSSPVSVGPGAFAVATHPITFRAYLTNRLTGHLYFLNGDTFAIEKDITLPGKAYAVAVNDFTNHLFVVDAANDRVYVLKADTGTLIATLPVGHQDADEGGQGIAVNFGGNNYIYVTNYADGTMTIIQDVSDNSTATPTPTATATETPTQTPTPTSTPILPSSPVVLTTFGVGPHPKDVAVNSTTNRFYVSTHGDVSQVQMFDGSNNAFISVASTQGNNPNQMEYDKGNNRLFITNRDSDVVGILDGDTLAGLGTAPTGGLPWGVTVNTTSHDVFAANFGSDSISIINGATGGLINTLKLATGDQPSMLAYNPNSQRVFAVGWYKGNLYVIDNQRHLSMPLSIGFGAFSVAVNQITNRVYITNRDNGKLYIVNADKSNVNDITLEQAVTVPGRPYGVAVNFRTDHVFVVGAETDKVYVFDGAGALLKTLAVGHQDADEGGQGIAVNPDTGRVYVANWAAGSVSVIQDVQMSLPLDPPPPTFTPTATRAPTLTPTSNNPPPPTATFTPTSGPTNVANACISAPGAPLLVSPSAGTVVTVRRVSLDWKPSTCATFYKVTVKQDASGATGIVAYSNNNVLTDAVQTTALMRGKTYYWRVRACSSTACGAFSAWRKFSVTP